MTALLRPFLILWPAKHSFSLPRLSWAHLRTIRSRRSWLPRYPLALGRDVLGLAPGETSLASVLKGVGYATASFGAANPYISAQFGYEESFDTFRDFLDAKATALVETMPIPNGNGWASPMNRKLQELRPRMGPLSSVYDSLYFQYCQVLATPAPGSLDALRRFPAADVIIDHALSWLESIGSVRFFFGCTSWIRTPLTTLEKRRCSSWVAIQSLLFVRGI